MDEGLKLNSKSVPHALMVSILPKMDEGLKFGNLNASTAADCFNPT